MFQGYVGCFLVIVQNLSVLMGFLVVDVGSGLAPDGNVQPVADIYQQWLKNSNAFSKCVRNMSCGYKQVYDVYEYIHIYIYTHISG